MHGFALNVNVDLEYFKNIIPVVLVIKVTSMHQELGRLVVFNEVEERLLLIFQNFFKCNGKRIALECNSQ